MEDIRQTHYDAWARSKRWVEIEVLESKISPGKWRSNTIPKQEGDPAYSEIRDTKQQAIYAIVSKCQGNGFEVSNLPEIYGIK